MNIRVLVASALALAIAAPAANALSLVNADKTDYKVTVTPKGGKAADVTVKASATVDIDCKAGCQLALNGKTQDVDAKTAKIWIKAGLFAAK
jgi:hypothetical protein